MTKAKAMTNEKSLHAMVLVLVRRSVVWYTVLKTEARKTFKMAAVLFIFINTGCCDEWRRLAAAIAVGGK